ncbi:ABC transporter permease [Clostridium sp. WILCCON 0269]|uniref:ABC transporter permease n=1 Tax=Candidatus Clostridium eludens TaxID=3381663 RepID=A0ABW8SMD2_9CLOT
MNILNIAFKEAKESIRDVRTLVFMLAFPIVLILILGTAFSSVFDSDNSNVVSKDKINILYRNSESEQFSRYFSEFMNQGKKEGMNFTASSNKEDALLKVKQNKYNAYIEISKESVKLYENDGNSIENSIVQGMLEGFIGKYNLISEVMKVNPQGVNKIAAAQNKDDYIKEVSLNSGKAPGSMDYYSMSMSTLIALYASISSTSLMRKERTKNTALRLMAAPVSRSEILVGKVIGSIAQNVFCVYIVVAVSKFVFKANWGQHIGLVLIALLTEVILAVSFGLGISYMVKRQEVVRPIVIILIQVVAFIGGAYFPVSTSASSKSFMDIVVAMSPLTWNNAGLSKLIYANDTGAILPIVTLNIAIACVFLLVSAVVAGKREGI